MYSLHSDMGVEGEVFPCWNKDRTQKWPWLTRGVHDWESPNGLAVSWDQFGLGTFPDEQPHFLDDAEEDSDEEPDIFKIDEQPRKAKGKGKAKERKM